MTLAVAALVLLGCGGDSGSPRDAGDAPDGIIGCVSAVECAVGMDYRSAEACARPGAYRVSYIEAEPCVTRLGEVPGPACAVCAVTSESGRGGRLAPGRRWSVACVDGGCVAAEEACPSCPANGPCATSLDCPLGYFCDGGTCAWGCDTGFDCAPEQVCVREPPDAAHGRCVLSGP